MAFPPASNVAWPLTLSVVFVASVIEPLLVSARLLAELLPVRTVAESSLIVTAPPLNVRLSKLVMSTALSPSVMAFPPAFSVA